MLSKPIASVCDQSLPKGFASRTFKPKPKIKIPRPLSASSNQIFLLCRSYCTCPYVTIGPAMSCSNMEIYTQ